MGIKSTASNAVVTPLRKAQSCQVVFELFSILIPQNQYFAEEIRIFRAAIT